MNGFEPDFIVLDEVHVWETEQGLAFEGVLDEIARGQFARMLDAREAEARTAALDLLPARLAWLIDHPRLLGVVYRLRPSWRPTIVDRDLGARVWSTGGDPSSA